MGGVEDPNYFSDAEYAGGYDEVNLADYGVSIPGADYVEVNLYYQTTSREYIEFLRDEINGTGNLTLSSPTPSGEPNAYVVQSDDFFSQLKAWGDTIWNLWTHNVNVPGAAPFLMTQATFGAPTVCGVSAPTLDTATPGNTQVTLEWSAASGATGYKVYYDQATKAQLVANAGNTTSYVDTGLTNGQQYCYKVTAYDGTCESDFSNILCAIPKGDQLASVGVGSLITLPPGSTTFRAGDPIPFQASVVWVGGTPVTFAGSFVSLAITGPTSLTLTTGQIQADGTAEATWPTQKGRNKTPSGDYRVEVIGVTLDQYVWDGVQTSTTFTIR